MQSSAQAAITFSARVLLGALTVAHALQPSWAAAVARSDPCASIAGLAFAPPADVIACQKSFPFNETLRQNVLANIAGVFDFYTFENYYLDSPAPFEESTDPIRENIARINSTTYETDYDFNFDLWNFTIKLNDGHTRWYPYCYTTYQNLLPAPVVSLDIDGTQNVYIVPDLVEYISLIGDGYTSYYDSIGFDWKRLAGAKVLQIGGMDAYDYVDYIASTVSGNFLDHGVRVNSVFSGYRISSDAFSQRIGDLAGPSWISQTDLTFVVVLANSTEEETVTVPYLADFAGNDFTDATSYWENNCAANDETNGIDYKTSSATRRRSLERRMARGDIKDLSLTNAVALPDPYLPTLPALNGSSGIVYGYVLPDNKTGALFVGSFSPDDFDGFQTQVDAIITAFTAAGVTRLLVDVTNNGGGYVCLGFFLHNYLTGNNIGNPGFQSSARANPLAQKIVASDIELGLDDTYTFYTADNYAFLNNTEMPASYNYMDPNLSEVVNGEDDPQSQRFFDTCQLTYVVDIPTSPPFALENVAIVTNGWCASTCALFTTVMNERENVTIGVFGGKPGEDVQFKGMAGNQVLEWYDLDSEIKTANLGNDSSAPPDLLIDGDMRVNWRTAWSYFDETKPIAYVSELPKYRWPYTADTYNNPQNLWIFASSEIFD